MKINIKDYDPSNHKVSRTTLWRAKKRGYFVPRYHERWANVEAKPSPEFEGISKIIQQEARRLVRHMLGMGYPIPSYMDEDDLVAECVAEVWRVSSKPGFSSSSWRYEVMRRQVKKISSMCAFDRDIHNLVEAQ